MAQVEFSLRPEPIRRPREGVAKPWSWIDDNLTGRTTEQNLQAIQNVSTENAFATYKVRLQPARVILTVKLSPDKKCERSRGAAGNPTYQALYAHRWG